MCQAAEEDPQLDGGVLIKDVLVLIIDRTDVIFKDVSYGLANLYGRGVVCHDIGFNRSRVSGNDLVDEGEHLLEEWVNCMGFDALG